MTIAALRYLAIPLLGALVAWVTLTRLDTAELKRQLGPHGGRRAAMAAIAIGLAFSSLLVARYATWHTYVFDLGLYDQKAWFVATQDSLSRILEQTYRGGVKVAPCGTARYWGVCHFQPLYVFYGFLYRVWASPLVLLISQALLVASGIIPCYLLARERLQSSEAGVLVSLLYLLQPAVQFNGLLDFRPDHVVIPFLLWAYWLADRGHVAAAVLAPAIPALAKETLLVTVAFFGLYLALGRRRVAAGVAIFAVGIAAFALVAFHVLAVPGRSEGTFLVSRYFSAGMVLLTPELVARKVIYLSALFGPLAFVSWLDPLAMLPAIPSLGTSLLSSDATHMSIQSQYTASVIPPAFAALCSALVWLRRRSAGRVDPIKVLGALVVLSAFFSIAQGATPLSINFWSESWGRQWHYRQYLPDRQAALNEAAAMIPSDPDVMVIAQNDVNSATLAHRHYFFAFPNGLERADYVLLDTKRKPFIYWVVPRDPEPYDALVQRLRGSPEYRLTFDRDGVLLFARTGERRPGPPDLETSPWLPRELPQ